MGNITIYVLIRCAFGRVLLIFEFRVSSLDFRISSLDFRVSSFDFRVKIKRNDCDDFLDTVIIGSCAFYPLANRPSKSTAQLSLNDCYSTSRLVAAGAALMGPRNWRLVY